MNDKAYFLGIDLGTQGVRVVLLDNAGNVITADEKVMPLTDSSRQQQDVENWWLLSAQCIRSVLKKTESSVRKNIIAVSVSSTSGTVIPLNKNDQPVHPAIMYSDKRSADQSARCASITAENLTTGFTRFNSSCGLPKILWFMEQFPHRVGDIKCWVHAADYITGKLSGVFNTTDYTNALKTGYDLIHLCWPGYITEVLGIKKEWLPQVVPSGTVIGKISGAAATETGLPEHIVVTVGITDGCASQIASGATQPGQWNTTIGTTLVIKGVTQKPVTDREGRLYNHRHPEGYWMPGGAGNIGADWVTKEFPEQFIALNEAAEHVIPTGAIAYPLLAEGERFPFIAPRARGFQPPALSPELSFAAKMEGVAYVERYAYELIRRLSGEEISEVYTAGGASRSDTWLKIRSAILNKPIYKMKHVSGAVGAAIVAASQTHFSTLSAAAKTLVQKDKLITPQKYLSEQYESFYHSFIAELIARNYIG